MTRKAPVIASAFALLALAFSLFAAAQAPSPTRQTNTVRQDAHIRSQADLDRYFRQHAGKPTPFDALSPGARERFLLSLHWGRGGLASFDPGTLSDQLSRDEVRAFLSLFGPEVAPFAEAVQVRTHEPRAGHALGAVLSDIERRYNQLYRIAMTHGNADDPTDRRAVIASFDAAFPETADPASLEHVRDGDLQLLARAASMVHDYSSHPRHLEAIRNVFTERQARGQADVRDVRELYQALLRERRFDDARRLQTDWPEAGLAPLPAFQDPLPAGDGRPSVWRISRDGTSLHRSVVDLAPTQILVTAGCHFSVNAAEDILADPLLGPIFKRHARWLVLPPGRESIEAIREWNRRFPEAPANPLYDRQAWSMLPAGWAMPAFHVVRGGRIVDSVTGWPRAPASNRQPLIDMLRRAGLAASDEAVVPADPDAP